MANRRIGLILGAALVATMLGLKPAFAARSIFLAADPDGTSCSINVAADESVTFYILADPDAGLTGAEFRVTGLPGTQSVDWTVNLTPAAAANVVVGDPFGGVGANIAFPTCQSTNPTLLYTVMLTINNPVLLVPDLTLTVEARNPSTPPGFDCPLHTQCDSPDFTPVCVAGGQLVLNPSAGPIDCPLFPENTPTPTGTPTATPSPTVTPTGTPTATPTIPAIERAGGALACNDQIDNDRDSLLDCADPDCWQTPLCAAPVPTVSKRTVLALAILVCLVGLFGVAQRRRGT